MNMDIVIPSHHRVGAQDTLTHMAPELRRRTILVGPTHEYPQHLGHSYMEGVRFLPQPDGTRNISDVRAFLLRIWGGGPTWGLGENTNPATSDNLLMLDDDLRFYIRREDKVDRLRYATHEEQVAWFKALSERLGPEVPHGGFGTRRGNNNQEPKDGNWLNHWTQGRVMSAIAFHAPTVVAECELGRIDTREDFDYTLQLMRRGYPNTVCQTFVQGDGGYSAPGGCSVWRTTETSDRDAHKLAELHPGLVKIKKKEFKNTPRLEITVSWQKALREGRERRAREAATEPAVTG